MSIPASPKFDPADFEDIDIDDLDLTEVAADDPSLEVHDDSGDRL